MAFTHAIGKHTMIEKPDTSSDDRPMRRRDTMMPEDTAARMRSLLVPVVGQYESAHD